MEKLKHKRTRHIFNPNWRDNARLGVGELYSQGHLSPQGHLISLQPSIWHECSDPNCPGAINRRKLEVAEEMAATLVEVQDNLNQYHPMVKKIQQMISTWEKAEKGGG